MKKHGIEAPPALSTIGTILKRYGLVKARRRKAPGAYTPAAKELTQAEHPNDVWSVDDKGWFVLGDGRRCDPLTVCDLFTHSIIGCRARPNQQYEGTLLCFKALMRYHGLPRVIRVDHGVPFASIGLGKLSKLSVWWIKQGITVEFIKPGCPQQNGSHERMHRDLKAEATQPPSKNLAAQQRRFQRWKDEYNHERPHEAIGMKRPAELYHASKRRLGENDKIRYPKAYTVRKLSETGQLSYEGKNYHVGEALAGCQVGLHCNDEGTIELYFANVHLGNLAFGSEGRFRPTAYIAPPKKKTLDQSTSKNHQ